MISRGVYLKCFFFFLVINTVFLTFSCAKNPIDNSLEEEDSREKDPVEGPSVTPVDLYGQLSVKGTQLVDEKGAPVVLRGVSFGWHMWWPRFYNKHAVSYLMHDWKCSVVRAAMGVGVGQSFSNSYLQNPKFGVDCVTTVVDAAIEKGIYVIIDFHTHDIYLDEATTFFTEMATKYKGHPNVIYEIFNEPLNTHTWEEVKEYSEAMIEVIRAIDPHNVILVGSPSWDQDLHLVAADPIKGQSNIMYTMHFYAASHKKTLRDRCDVAIAAGVPIFVSECAGMEATGDGPINFAEWNRWLEWMEAHKISWVTWSIADKNETCSMFTPDAPSDGGWLDSHIKIWGQEVRKTIREKNRQRD